VVSSSSASGDSLQSAANQSGAGIGSFISSASWGAAHVYRDSGYKDGVFYVENFTDNAGSNTGPTTYGQIFGGVYIKNNAGSGQVFWGNVQHHGSGQMGLFIGSIQNTSGDLGGDFFAIDAVMTDNVGVNQYGARIQFSPATSTAGSGKTSIGLRISNTNPTNVVLNQAIRVEGAAGWTNPIIVYSDSGSTPAWYIDSAGNMTSGTHTPISSSVKDLGSVSFKWRNGYFGSTLYVAGASTTGGGSGGISLAAAATNPTSDPSSGGFLYAANSTNQPSWYGADGVTGTLLIGQAVQPSAPTRALGTAYQPSTTRTTLVTVTMNMTAATGVTSGVKINMDANNPPTTEYCRTDVFQSGAVSVASNTSMTFPVPPGFYYEIVNLGGSPPIVEVKECYL
jgi:hypothetical protein